jgi:cell division protein FtsB
MRFRAFIFPLLALGAGGYFGYHLQNGDHGLAAKTDLQRRAAVLEGELEGLREVRQRIERDVALLGPDSLDERARAILNLAHPSDLVMMNRRPADPTGPLIKR